MISANSLEATQARRAVLYCDMGRYYPELFILLYVVHCL